MDPAASLKQTVTHLFDAVRYHNHSEELEESARDTENGLKTELARLESHTEELSKILTSMKSVPDGALADLSDQVGDFVHAAKEQAEEKLRRKAKEEVEEYRNRASVERDKALKSLEAYLAADPLPIIESAVQVRLAKGLYEGSSRYECDGGISYDFRLAPQNSRLFHQEFSLSLLGYELKVPVRFSRVPLKKDRVPGFERLDKYTLVAAESSGGKMHASFERAGGGARMKVVTSGSAPEDFVSLEYSDQSVTVNVLNDPALASYSDLPKVRKAMGELALGLEELARKKVALMRISIDGEGAITDLDYGRVLLLVFKTLAPNYLTVLEKMPKEKGGSGGNSVLSLAFIKERLKVLGELSEPASKTLGLSS